MVVKAVFFDLVDTLVVHDNPGESWPLFMATLHGCLGKHGLELADRDFAEQCELHFQQGQPPDAAGLTVFERRILALSSEAGLALKTADVQEAAETIIATWRRYVSLDPDCHHVLAELRQRRTLVLISNYDHPPAIHDLLRDMDLRKYFSMVIISGEVGCQKPDPRIFRIALDRMGLTSEEAIHVGDSPDDVNGALAAGVVPIRIQRDASQRPMSHPDVRTIHRLSDLLGLV